MSDPLRSRGRIPLPLIAAVGGVLVAGVLLMGQAQQLARLKRDLLASQQQVAQLTTQNQDLTRKLDAFQTDRNSLTERVTSLRSELTTASGELERSRVMLEDLKGRYEQLTKTHLELQSQLANMTAERDEAKKRVARLEEENKDFERSASRVRERLTLLDRDYKQLADKLVKLDAERAAENAAVLTKVVSTPDSKVPALLAAAPDAPGTVELPPIIVGRDQPGMSVPLRGRLLDVNEPQNFVVVDKGSLEGVRVGMTLNILRGTATVGRVNVIRVRPHLSACDIIRSKTPGPLQPGDVAVQAGT